MRAFRRLIAALAMTGWSLWAPAGFAQDATDEWEGLPEGPGREEVFYTCNACHSLKLVTQQGLRRSRWDDILVWMVDEQGMPELDTDERNLVLDYLATHYGEDR